MLNQLGFDFGDLAAPSAKFAEQPACTWLDRTFTTAQFIAMFSIAEDTVKQIVGPGRPLFELGIATAKAQHADMLARRAYAPTDSYRLWRSNYTASAEQLRAFVAHCETHDRAGIAGIEYKTRRDRRMMTAAMYVPNIGTVIVRQWFEVDNVGLDFIPYRDAFFHDSYRDGMPAIEAPYALWGSCYCADKLAYSHDDIASVPAFTIQGRLYLNTGGMGSGTYRECDGWLLCPKSDWTGPTYTYRTQCQAWDDGRKERGDKRGLVVRVQGQLCVCESPAHVFDCNVPADVDLYRPDDDEADELGDDPTGEDAEDCAETACDLLAA